MSAVCWARFALLEERHRCLCVCHCRLGKVGVDGCGTKSRMVDADTLTALLTAVCTEGGSPEKSVTTNSPRWSFNQVFGVPASVTQCLCPKREWQWHLTAYIHHSLCNANVAVVCAYTNHSVSTSLHSPHIPHPLALTVHYL